MVISLEPPQSSIKTPSRDGINNGQFSMTNMVPWSLSERSNSWEARAFAEDASNLAAATAIWPPRSYSCSFCGREFRSAQALGGHMNIHRRDRARLRELAPPRCGTASYSTRIPHAETSTVTSEADPYLHHHSSDLGFPPKPMDSSAASSYFPRRLELLASQAESCLLKMQEIASDQLQLALRPTFRTCDHTAMATGTAMDGQAAPMTLRSFAKDSMAVGSTYSTDGSQRGSTPSYAGTCSTSSNGEAVGGLMRTMSRSEEDESPRKKLALLAHNNIAPGSEPHHDIISDSYKASSTSAAQQADQLRVMLSSGGCLNISVDDTHAKRCTDEAGTIWGGLDLELRLGHIGHHV